VAIYQSLRLSAHREAWPSSIGDTSLQMNGSDEAMMVQSVFVPQAPERETHAMLAAGLFWWRRLFVAKASRADGGPY
jgi:hypothetical protein